ncbi:MAG: phage major capsid protein [Hyphomicrobiaceae bacterium]
MRARHQRAPQIKAATGEEVALAFDQFMRAFEAFKEVNDERLEAIEKRVGADVVTLDKLERINRAVDEQKRLFDELQLKARRPGRGLALDGVADDRHRSAFDAYVRKGDVAALAGLEAKALSAGSGQDGGYLVPAETETTVMSALKAISPIRAIATVRQVSGTVYKKPFSTTGFGTGWVGETAARPETTTSTLAELSFPAMELYAMPAASSALLDDTAVDIDAWIADEVRNAFAEQEGAAFVVGDGTSKPRGFLDYQKIANTSWTWDKIGYLTTGASGAFAATSPGDRLIDLVYALKAGYRANGHFVMNRSTQAAIRKLKDADGNYLWQPASGPDGQPTLLNFPIAEAEDMPDIGADSFALAFGDFARGYLVVDRVGIRVLRDPYSAKPYVLFYTTKRVGGGVQDFDAIKLLKFGTA